MPQQNIDSHEAMMEALAQGRIKPGDRIHLGLSGSPTEDAYFVDYDPRRRAFTYRIGKHDDTLDWGDIREMWPVSLKDVAARAAAT